MYNSCGHLLCNGAWVWHSMDDQWDCALSARLKFYNTTWWKAILIYLMLVIKYDTCPLMSSILQGFGLILESKDVTDQYNATIGTEHSSCITAWQIRSNQFKINMWWAVFILFFLVNFTPVSLCLLRSADPRVHATFSFMTYGSVMLKENRWWYYIPCREKYSVLHLLFKNLQCVLYSFRGKALYQI